MQRSWEEKAWEEQIYLDTLMEYHRKQWNWVAEETKKQQRKVYPKEYLESLSGDDYKTVHRIIKEISPEENGGWFACCFYKHKYGTCHMSSSNCTDNCPIKWDGPRNFRAVCWAQDSSYRKWEEAEDLMDCIRFAEIIARLPMASNRPGLYW